MPRPPSGNPGQTVHVYLRGCHLDVLRRYPGTFADAVRRVLEEHAQVFNVEHLPAPTGLSSDSVTPSLCDACMSVGYPRCPACLAL